MIAVFKRILLCGVDDVPFTLPDVQVIVWTRETLFAAIVVVGYNVRDRPADGPASILRQRSYQLLAIFQIHSPAPDYVQSW